MADLKAGTLGGATLSANQEVVPYQVEAPAIASTFNVSFCNRGTEPAVVYLAYGTGTDSKKPGTVFWEFNAVVKPGIPLERTALAISRGMRLFAGSDCDLVDVAVHGYERG